jgi:hypothetical protein
MNDQISICTFAGRGGDSHFTWMTAMLGIRLVKKRIS